MPNDFLWQYWYDLWTELGINLYDPAGRNFVNLALARVLKRYMETHRAYHGIGHILRGCVRADTMGVREVLKEHYPEWLLAWMLHDVDYEVTQPLAKRNEYRSMLFARDLMLSSRAFTPYFKDLRRVARCCCYIMATTHTYALEGLGSRLIVDNDLAELGSSQDAFRERSAEIRFEDADVPLPLYNKKRGEILQGFFDRPRIFLTDLYFEKFEAAARSNLEYAIRELKSINGC